MGIEKPEPPVRHHQPKPKQDKDVPVVSKILHAHKPAKPDKPVDLPISTTTKYITLAARVIVFVAVVVGIIITALHIDTVGSIIQWLLRSVDKLNMVYGAAILAGVTIVGAVLVLPCVPFTLAAGFLFGVPMGSMIIAVSCTIASVIAFLVGRYLARGLVEKAQNAKLRTLDQAIRDDGFRVVFLIRLSPLHPYGVFNYLLGVTSIALSDYTLSTFIGMLPSTVMEVYFGSAMKDMTQLLSGNLGEGFISQLFFWGGLLMTIVSSVYVTIWVKRKLDSQLAAYELAQPCDVELETVVTCEPEDTQGSSLKSS